MRGRMIGKREEQEQKKGGEIVCEDRGEGKGGR